MDYILGVQTLNRHTDLISKVPNVFLGEVLLLGPLILEELYQNIVNRIIILPYIDPLVQRIPSRYEWRRPPRKSYETYK